MEKKIGITKALVVVCSLILGCLVSGCGSAPIWLRSSRDIASASSGTEMVHIGELPVADYPALRKFRKLNYVDFEEGTGPDEGTGSDEKLKSLAGIDPSNLRYVCICASHQVTDKGMEYLAAIPSIRILYLRRTSITDAGIETLVAKMRLTVVDVSDCPGVTFAGLERLASSPTLEGLYFSGDTLDEAQVLSLIARFQRVVQCDIEDASGRLDTPAIRQAAQTKGVTLVVRNPSRPDQEAIQD